MTLWKDGFSIEDGPLMRLDDPANKEYLEAINRGYEGLIREAPIALMDVRPGQEVEVKLHNRMNEDYKAPPKKLKTFSGAGNRLGSYAPADQAQSLPAQPSAPPASMTVDPNQPSTQIQFRLADGTRLVSRFNHTHTVGDLYSFVRMYRVLIRSRPAARPFQLQTSMPTKNIDENSATIKDAGLLNAVVFQKYI